MLAGLGNVLFLSFLGPNELSVIVSALQRAEKDLTVCPFRGIPCFALTQSVASESWAIVQDCDTID